MKPFFLFAILIAITSCKNSPEKPIDNVIEETETAQAVNMKTDTVYIKDTLIVTEILEGEVKIPILSNSINILYSNCRNTISFDIPDAWKISDLSASNAEVIQSKTNNRQVTLVPKGSKCLLSMNSTTPEGKTILTEREFRVIHPPKPSIELLVNNKLYNGATPISNKSNFMIKVVPDPDFASAFPQDARYTISTIDLLAHRSLGPPTKIGSFSGEGKDGTAGIPVQAGSALRQDRPGTKIYFRINNISRVNFQEERIEEKFPVRELNVGAMIK